jgi:hypothetical protein
LEQRKPKQKILKHGCMHAVLRRHACWCGEGAALGRAEAESRSIRAGSVMKKGEGCTHKRGQCLLAGAPPGAGVHQLLPASKRHAKDDLPRSTTALRAPPRQRRRARFAHNGDFEIAQFAGSRDLGGEELLTLLPLGIVAATAVPGARVCAGTGRRGGGGDGLKDGVSKGVWGCRA